MTPDTFDELQAKIARLSPSAQLRLAAELMAEGETAHAIVIAERVVAEWRSSQHFAQDLKSGPCT